MIGEFHWPFNRGKNGFIYRSCYYLNSKVISGRNRTSNWSPGNLFSIFTCRFIWVLTSIWFNVIGHKKTKQTLGNISQFHFTKWFSGAIERLSKHCFEFEVFLIFTDRNCEFFIEVALKSAEKEFRKIYLNSIAAFSVYALHKRIKYRRVNKECV